MEFRTENGHGEYMIVFDDEEQAKANIEEIRKFPLDGVAFREGKVVYIERENVLGEMQEREALKKWYNFLSDDDKIKEEESEKSFIENYSFKENVYIPQNNEMVEEFSDCFKWYEDKGEKYYIVWKEGK
ncbi:MAG: hypothetical protein ACOCRX_09585 [Candidatus Woesearchaeota archaeon]